MKVALIHDWLVTPGGAENVLEALCEAFPGASVFTLVYQPENFTGSIITKHSVTTSFLQRFPGITRYYRRLIGLMPYAVEQFDLREFDVVISSSHAVAKGALTRSDQLHIAYVHTPMRYIWDLYHEYVQDLSRLERWLAGPVFHYLRLWDVVSSGRVDHFVANSHYVGSRIRKVYQRTSKVIYPPVDVEFFQQFSHLAKEDYFITAARFVPYKRLDVIIQAFNRLGLRLLVIGSGPDDSRLRAMAGKNITFLGRVSREVLAASIARARAFVYAAEEDFGIVLVEAQAAGTPVIAYGRGGAREIVVPWGQDHREGATGFLYNEQTPEALVAAVKDFLNHECNLSPFALQENVKRFSKARFINEFKNYVKELCG